MQAVRQEQLVARRAEQAHDQVAAEGRHRGARARQQELRRAGRRAGAARGSRTARRRASSGSRRSSPGRPTPPSCSTAATTARGTRARRAATSAVRRGAAGRAISRPSSPASRTSAIGPQTDESIEAVQRGAQAAGGRDEHDQRGLDGASEPSGAAPAASSGAAVLDPVAHGRPGPRLQQHHGGRGGHEPALPRPTRPTRCPAARRRWRRRRAPPGWRRAPAPPPAASPGGSPAGGSGDRARAVSSGIPPGAARSSRARVQHRKAGEQHRGQDRRPTAALPVGQGHDRRRDHEADRQAAAVAEEDPRRAGEVVGQEAEQAPDIPAQRTASATSPSTSASAAVASAVTPPTVAAAPSMLSIRLNALTRPTTQRLVTTRSTSGAPRPTSPRSSAHSADAAPNSTARRSRGERVDPIVERPEEPEAERERHDRGQARQLPAHGEARERNAATTAAPPR